MPSSLEAERAVLGGLMLDPGRLDEVAEVLQPDAFYREAHKRLFQLMLDMGARGEPTEMVAVVERVMAQGAAEVMGGLPYISALPDNVPSTENLLYYAGVVQDRAVRRRLLEACQKVAGRVYAGEDELAELLDGAEGQVLAVTREGVKQKDWEGTEAIGKALIDDLIARQNAPRDAAGIPTGYRGLDRLLNGLRKQQLLVLAARPRMGKAQPLTAKILTPSGWRRMGDMAVGDRVVGPDGLPKRVLGVHPQGTKDVYEVVTSDGCRTECCDDHLWHTTTRNERRSRNGQGSVKTLREIRQTLQRQDRTGPNHALPLLQPVVFEDHFPQGRPLHPYLLGLLLGDGSLMNMVRFTKPEADVQARGVALLPAADTITPIRMGWAVKRRQRNNQRSDTAIAIEALGLRGCHSYERFIPPAYLCAPMEDRMELLRGLLDTDGSVVQTASVEYGTSSERLARDMLDLVRGLGFQATCCERSTFFTYKGERRIGRPSWRILIRVPDDRVPVSSEKHLKKWRAPTVRAHQSIVEVRPVGQKVCQCITVEGGLYVTDDFIVTHNSALALNICHNLAAQGHRVGFLSLEMSKAQLMTRLYAGLGFVNLGHLLNGTLTRPEWSSLLQAQVVANELPIHIDDAPGLTLREVRTRALRLKRDYPDLALLVVDYLGIMSAANSRMTAEQAVAENAQGLKNLAKELDLPVLVLAQLNRSCEQRPDKRPMLSDLRSSGAVEQAADVVIFIYRDQVYSAATSEPTVGEVIVAKQREGREGTVKLLWMGEYTRFEDPAF